jgi:hypothetical protein
MNGTDFEGTVSREQTIHKILKMIDEKRFLSEPGLLRVVPVWRSRSRSHAKRFCLMSDSSDYAFNFHVGHVQSIDM